MSFNPAGCSHGVAWDKTCNDCESISLKQNLYDLSTDCKACADALTKQPMMCSSPEVVIDLYRTVDRLASLLLRLDIKNEPNK